MFVFCLQICICRTSGDTQRSPMSNLSWYNSITKLYARIYIFFHLGWYEEDSIIGESRSCRFSPVKKGWWD